MSPQDFTSQAGRTVRALRQQAGYKLVGFAGAMRTAGATSMTASLLSGLERGRRTWNLPYLCAAAEVLSVDPDLLLLPPHDAQLVARYRYQGVGSAIAWLAQRLEPDAGE